MSKKQLITFGKLLLLLLLFSNPAVAKTFLSLETNQESKEVTFFKAEYSFHKDGLQPQIPSVRIISEHHAKPISFGYGVQYYEYTNRLVQGYVGPTMVLLQDANRCESVSRFLFPYHIFW